ncbi:hypothetical protein [Jiella sonneratiae]|uniref:Uncharacterized protein n=1 Tax=Jiella sonneratiae TaxID=2816856 RepID=A0ABS3J809_9HYPH|nr:hypothetical protein [Jiella sonneratiae]MBO0905809.1 hypothetical protein [Jiella sonneratiae]
MATGEAPEATASIVAIGRAGHPREDLIRPPDDKGGCKKTCFDASRG